MKSSAVNYQSLTYLKSIIGVQVEILDLVVKNKWLIASLSSGVNFKVLNHPFQK